MSRLFMLVVLLWLPVFATVIWIFGGCPWVDCLQGLWRDWSRYWKEGVP